MSAKLNEHIRSVLSTAHPAFFALHSILRYVHIEVCSANRESLKQKFSKL
jgi:hypothetical protein